MLSKEEWNLWMMAIILYVWFSVFHFLKISLRVLFSNNVSWDEDHYRCRMRRKKAGRRSVSYPMPFKKLLNKEGSWYQISRPYFRIPFTTLCCFPTCLNCYELKPSIHIKKNLKVFPRNCYFISAANYNRKLSTC